MQCIHIKHGDITRIAVDVIVNAANQRLLGGAGVDGAIHKAGGPSIMTECNQIRAEQGGCQTGEAVITNAGNLPAKKVVHTVGPIYTEGDQNQAKLLSNCYLNSLKLSEKHAYDCISFPNISTGVYGYPKEQAAEIAINTVSAYLAQADSQIDRVVFVCYNEENFSIYQTLLKEVNNA